MNTTIKCPHCAGKGRVEPEKALPKALAEMLNIVPAFIAISPGLMADNLGISENGINNRLRTLLRLGLVRRFKSGGRYVYTRVIRERKQA